jgi:hypothetical protein
MSKIVAQAAAVILAAAAEPFPSRKPWAAAAAAVVTQTLKGCSQVHIPAISEVLPIPGIQTY